MSEDGAKRATTPANRLAPDGRAGSPPRSTAKGDVPQAILDRYLIERDLRGRAERFYRDHRASDPSFRDRGGSLTADHAYPDAVIDMLKIARHRGWAGVRVNGSDAFRREVWIQAQTLGLEVAGHRPRERDRQAAGLEKSRSAAPSTDLAARIERAAVVVRHLIPDAAIQARLMERVWTRVREGRSRAAERHQDRDRRR